jgi:ribosomal protein L12E/L44/L45/RPP1/RPP2
MADSTLRLPDSYLLLQSGGNASPSAQDIKTVLSAVGCALRSVYGAAN